MTSDPLAHGLVDGCSSVLGQGWLRTVRVTADHEYDHEYTNARRFAVGFVTPFVDGLSHSRHSAPNVNYTEGVEKRPICYSSITMS